MATLPSLEKQLNYCTVLHVPVSSVVEVPVVIICLLLLVVAGVRIGVCCWGVRIDGVCCCRCKDRWCSLLEV